MSGVSPGYSPADRRERADATARQGFAPVWACSLVAGDRPPLGATGPDDIRWSPVAMPSRRGQISGGKPDSRQMRTLGWTKLRASRRRSRRPDPAQLAITDAGGTGQPGGPGDPLGGQVARVDIGDDSPGEHLRPADHPSERSRLDRNRERVNHGSLLAVVPGNGCSF
jgi:hypothetical protein